MGAGGVGGVDQIVSDAAQAGALQKGDLPGAVEGAGRTTESPFLLVILRTGSFATRTARFFAGGGGLVDASDLGDRLRFNVTFSLMERK